MPEVPLVPTGLDLRLVAGAVAILVILAGVFVFVLLGASSPQGQAAVPSATPSAVPSASVPASQTGAPTSTPFATATVSPNDLAAVTPPPGKCYSAVGVDDYSHHGYALGGTGPICVPRHCEDTCSGPTTLVKWYCNGDVPTTKTVECNGPCTNGACPPAREPA